MKVRVDRTELDEALSWLGRLSSRHVAITHAVRLTAEDGSLVVERTSLGTWGTATLAADVGDGGCCAASAKILSGLVGRMEGEVVTLQESGGFRVSCGRTEAAVRQMPEDDFPPPGGVDGLRPVGDLPLEEIRRRVVPYVRDVGKAISGVHVGSHDGRLYAVATDKNRMAVLDCGVAGDEADVILDPEGLDLAGAASEFATVEVSNSRVRITADNAEVTSGLVAASYPAWPRVIPGDDRTEAVAEIDDPSQLVSAVRRCAVVASEHNNKILVSVGDGRIDLSSDHQESGAVEDSVECETQGSVTAAFNAKFLTDALGAAGECQWVLNGAEGPSVLHAHKGRYRHLLMPMSMG